MENYKIGSEGTSTKNLTAQNIKLPARCWTRSRLDREYLRKATG